MKLYKLDLLTLLVSLFSLSACQNSDGVGLEVDPANAINGYAIDNISIKSQTVPEGAIDTRFSSKHPLGDMTEEIFGLTKASIYFGLSLPADSVSFGTNPELDSAVLVLNYAKEFTGDSTTTFKFNVHQLTEQLTASSDYKNTAVHGFTSDVIGTKTSKVNLKDSVKINTIVTAGADVVKAQSPQLRIPISAGFIKSNFLEGNRLNFRNNYLFSQFIKGLHVSMNKVEAGKVGGLVLLDLTSPASTSRLEIYYKNKNTTKTDTNLTSFTIQTSSLGAAVAATIVHNYDGTAIQNQLARPEIEATSTYVQGLGGLRTKLNITNLQALKDLGNIIVNKAELTISVPDGTYNKVAPAPRIYLYTTDIAGQRALLPDNALLTLLEQRGLADLQYGGFYDGTTKKYKFIITSYLQDLIRNERIPYDLYLSAADPSVAGSSAMSPKFTSTGQVVLGSGNNASSFKMKLNVIYTKVN
jgi:hypothetical protein